MGNKTQVTRVIMFRLKTPGSCHLLPEIPVCIGYPQARQHAGKQAVQKALKPSFYCPEDHFTETYVLCHHLSLTLL